MLIPHAPLQLIIQSVQVLAGIMLPSAITFLQLLLNDKEVLGYEYVNKAWNNWVNWTIDHRPLQFFRSSWQPRWLPKAVCQNVGKKEGALWVHSGC